MGFVPAAGVLIADRYRLVRELGHGGMGAVWVARHIELDAEMAVKLILGEDDATAEARGRFRREAQAAARLKSPHITKIHDFGVHEGAPYIAMELLEGEDLDEVLGRTGRLPLDRVARIVTETCRALEEAHAAGVIHRDIKPSNIFLARAGESEIVKLLDFGIAKVAGAVVGPAERTRSGVVIGSPAYMSPEQTRGLAVDARSDLWSVGVVAFEMLTGESPFSREHLGDTMYAICSEPPPSARASVPELPPAIEGFFDRAFARFPDDRFASARALADALESVAAGAPLPEICLADTRRYTMDRIGGGATLASAGFADASTIAQSSANGIEIASARAPSSRGGRTVGGAIALAALLMVGGWMLGRVGLIGGAPATQLVAGVGSVVEAATPPLAAPSAAPIAPPIAAPPIVAPPTASATSSAPASATGVPPKQRAKSTPVPKPPPDPEMDPQFGI